MSLFSVCKMVATDQSQQYGATAKSAWASSSVPAKSMSAVLPAAVNAPPPPPLLSQHQPQPHSSYGAAPGRPITSMGTASFTSGLSYAGSMAAGIRPPPPGVDDLGNPVSR